MFRVQKGLSKIHLEATLAGVDARARSLSKDLFKGSFSATHATTSPCLGFSSKVRLERYKQRETTQTSESPTTDLKHCKTFESDWLCFWQKSFTPPPPLPCFSLRRTQWRAPEKYYRKKTKEAKTLLCLRLMRAPWDQDHVSIPVYWRFANTPNFSEAPHAGQSIPTFIPHLWTGKLLLCKGSPPRERMSSLKTMNSSRTACTHLS